MHRYEELDKRILAAVAKRENPNNEARCRDEAVRIADEERVRDRYNCRPAYRVIDGRLQALRKAGKIAHYTKAKKNGQGGWHIVTPNV